MRKILVSLAVVTTLSSAAEKPRHKRNTTAPPPASQQSSRAPAVLVSDAELVERYTKRAKLLQTDLTAFLDAMRAGDPQYVLLEHNVLSAIAISKALPALMTSLTSAKGLDLAGKIATLDHYAMTVDFLQNLARAYSKEIAKTGKNSFRERLSPLFRKDDDTNRNSVVSMQGEKNWETLKPFIKGGRILPGDLNLDGENASEAKVIEKLGELNAVAFKAVAPIPPVVEIKSQSIVGDKSVLESVIRNTATGEEFKVKTFADAQKDSVPKQGRAVLEQIESLRESTSSNVPPKIVPVYAGEKYSFMDLAEEGLPFSDGDRDEMRASNLHQFMQSIRIE